MTKRLTVSRRGVLAGFGGALGLGLGLRPHATARERLAAQRLAATQPGANVCILTPEAVQGPFYFDPKLVRADITEARPGAPLEVKLQIVEVEGCAGLKEVRVDIWQCDGLGVYSGYGRQATGSTEGETFLRGTQVTNAEGEVVFTSIYPGWYPGRTPHIHFKMLLDEANLVTGQLYFPDPVTERVYATLPPYNQRKGERDTFNATDFIFKGQGGADTLCAVTEEGGAFRASLVIGIDRGGRPT